MQFTVNPDGSVLIVHLTSSTLGSHQVEDCILDHASRLRFPRPHGGEAEFDYGPMEMSSDDSPSFEPWSPDYIYAELEGAREAINACGSNMSGFRVTIWVGHNGRARSVGVVPPTAEARESNECLVRALSDIQYPEPAEGHNLAKVTVELE